MSDPSGSERDVEGGEARNLTEIASRRGMQALLSRPREESQSLAAALAVRDVGTVIEPMMEVHYCVAHRQRRRQALRFFARSREERLHSAA